MRTCPSDNTADIDQSSFWSSGTLHWDAHRIGWAVAGACTVATLLVSIFSVLSHCRNYTNPRHQRQMDYTYYSFVEVAYEAITLSAFLLLLIQFVADKSSVQDNVMIDKDKKSLIFPFCCWRYRPTKPYFMHAIKWSVLQYVIVRPIVSVVGMICQAKGILCESQGFNGHFANVYVEAIDFVSISIALYGLLLFYALTKEDLVGQKPLAKFLCIKLIVMFTWYQSFVFGALQNRVIHGTEFWSSTNIANGLNALAICIEMILFAVFMWWAYPCEEYKRPAGTPATSIWRPLWDSINYSDFAREIISSVMYFVQPRKPLAYSNSGNGVRPKKASFDSAFLLNGHGISSRKQRPSNSGFKSTDIPLANQQATGISV